MTRATAAPRRTLAGLVAATLVAAAGLVGLTAAPAAAAYCSGSGVNVVVDFNGLGGGVQKGCDPNGGGRTADRIFPAAGFSLQYAQRQSGFVCRVQNAPQSDPCVNAAPADAYWGLFHSDGTSGRWSYASSGVGGLKVPEGGFVAFSWQNGGDRDDPSAEAVNKTSEPKPTSKPKPTPKPTPRETSKPRPTKTAGTTNPTTGPTRGGTPTPAPATSKTARTSSTTPSAAAAGSSKGASTSPTPSATTATPGSSETLEPSDTPTPSADAQPANGAFTPAEQRSGLPVWVPLLVVLALGAAGAGAVWWRRRVGLR